jgi:chromosome segregation ATPase
MSSTSY